MKIRPFYFLLFFSATVYKRWEFFLKYEIIQNYIDNKRIQTTTFSLSLTISSQITVLFCNNSLRSCLQLIRARNIANLQSVHHQSTLPYILQLLTKQILFCPRALRIRQQHVVASHHCEQFSITVLYNFCNPANILSTFIISASLLCCEYFN